MQLNRVVKITDSYIITNKIANNANILSGKSADLKDKLMRLYTVDEDKFKIPFMKLVYTDTNRHVTYL